MTRDDHRISVIITSYNQKGLLKEAVDSVLAQTVPAHEILVADDGSSDGSVELIREYMAKHPGLVKGVIQEHNVGIPRNRNTALEQVTGNYVAILDGDDRFLPQKNEREIAAFQANPDAGCVYSNVRYIESTGKPLHTRDSEVQPSGDVLVPFALGFTGILRSLLINFELFQEVGFMDERFLRVDGYDLTLRLAKRTPFVYLFEPLMEYRFNPVSDSKTITPEERLRELSGVYEKSQPLFADLTPEEKTQIKAYWEERFRKLARQMNEPAAVRFLRAKLGYWKKRIKRPLVKVKQRIVRR